jgi:hypothetical protein
LLRETGVEEISVQKITVAVIRLPVINANQPLQPSGIADSDRFFGREENLFFVGGDMEVRFGKTFGNDFIFNGQWIQCEQCSAFFTVGHIIKQILFGHPAQL